MTDIRIVLVSGLAGALVSAVVSALVALYIARRQPAKQRRYETWIRVLNGYHNFYTEGRIYLDFLAVGQHGLANESLRSVFKAARDVELLDPFGRQRANSMATAAAALPRTAEGVTHDARDSFQRVAETAYREFEADEKTRRWSQQPDRGPRRPF